MYNFVLIQRGRRWQYRVYDQDGRTVAMGIERVRRTARYQAQRALFAKLLCSPRLFGNPSGDVRRF